MHAMPNVFKIKSKKFSQEQFAIERKSALCIIKAYKYRSLTRSLSLIYYQNGTKEQLTAPIVSFKSSYHRDRCLVKSSHKVKDRATVRALLANVF